MSKTRLLKPTECRSSALQLACWVAACSLLLLVGCQVPNNTNTDDGSGAFKTGNYRNLFAEAGYSEREISGKINSAYKQLFHGDALNEAVYYPAGTNEHGPMAFIFDINSNDARSEGLSYGMMIAVQLDKQAEFDALWNWAKMNMYHDSPKHPAKGFFSWSVQTNGVANDEMPAPDGEEYFATALYFASARWGDGEGIYNYSSEADIILTDMRHRKLITGETVRGEMTAGNLFHPEHAMVRFTPDVVNAEHTDPSYHLPAFYEVWARQGPKEDREFWKRAATASRDFFQVTTHPDTALAPDYAEFDGSPWEAPWRSESVDFRFDAWRTAMNWSMDWTWWGVDERAQVLSDRLQSFFESEGIDTYVSQYSLDGEKLGNEHMTGLVAMNATASLAATHPRSEKFVNALWELSIPTGPNRYYDGMLYMMALLHCSGQYQVWAP